MPSIKNFISKEKINPDITSELERIEEEEGKKADRSKIFYKGYNKTHDFRKFKTMHAFGDDIRTNFIKLMWQTINKTIWQNILKNLKKDKTSTYF